MPSPVRRITDAGQWDRLVQGFAAHDLRQGFAWGELRREQGWDPYRFAVFQDGDCTAACMVLARRLPGLGVVLYAPRGPLYHASEPGGLGRLLNELRRFAARSGAVFVRLSPGVPMENAAQRAVLAGHELTVLPEPWTTWNTPRYVQVLDLVRDERTLLAGLRRRMREYVSAAPRRGIVIEASDRDDDLVAFHQLMVNVGRIKRFPVRDLAYYRALARRYRETGALSLLIARTAHAIVGGLLSVRFGRRAYLLHTSVRTTADHVKHHVAPAISWEFVRRARAAGCELADFGGSGVQLPPSEADPGWGVYHFKAGLGCRLETFVPFHDLVLRPALYRAVRIGEARVLPRMWLLMARVPRLVPRLPGAAA